MTINGTIVSNRRNGTQWMSGVTWVNEESQFLSGFRDRINIYTPDVNLAPPPFLPKISENFEFKGWEELLGNEF